MKTPREILLSQHRDAGAKLDAIRREVIAELNHKDSKAPGWILSFVSWCLYGSNKLWEELVLPSRRTWAGIAAVWMVILAIHWAQSGHSSGPNVSATPMMISFTDQQRLLSQMFTDRAPAAERDRPKNHTPQPRTELSKFQTA